MKGIVLASHGKFAEGILDTARMLFGDPEQTACVSLVEGMAPEEFQANLTAAIDSVNTGDGVIVLCDLLGGTPSNRAALLLSSVDVISGINLALLIELLGQRLTGDIDIPSLIDTAKQGIVYMNPLFKV